MVQCGVSLEALVTEAWRERWSELEWSIALQNALDEDSSDVHNLPRYLLTQATLSEVPNSLMFSYISYTVATQVVSHESLLSAVCAFRDFGRPHCVESILQLLNLVREKIRCEASDGFECEKLCWALSRSVEWLLDAVEGTLSRPAQTLLSKLTDALLAVARDPFHALCLYFHQLEKPEEHAAILEKASQVLVKMEASTWVSQPIKVEFRLFIPKYSSIPEMLKQGSVAVTHAAGAHPTVLTLASVFGTIRLTHSSQAAARALWGVADAVGLSWWLALRDFVRGALILQLDPGPHFPDSCVSAFVYLKVPKVMWQLVEWKWVTRADVLRAIEAVAGFHSLLNALDMKVRSDCFFHLLQELEKLKLVKDSELPALNEIRNRDKIAFTQPTPSNQAGLNLVLKAEPTFQTLIKSFNSDFALKQDKLVQMMCHMITGKSFEYICAAAAAINQLHDFVHKVIQFNRDSERRASETAEEGSQRSTLFDLSFLLLTRISLYYDVATPVPNEAKEARPKVLDGFFKSWSEVYGSQGILLVNPNADRTTRQFPHAEIAEAIAALRAGRPYWPQHCDWAEVAWKVPQIGEEILAGLESQELSAEEVGVMLEALQSRVCSLVLMLGAWLLHVPASPARRRLAGLLSHFLDSAPAGTEKKPHMDRWQFMGGTARKVVGQLLETAAVVSPTYPYLIAIGRHQLPKLNTLTLASAAQLQHTFMFALKNGWASATILEILYRASRNGQDELWTGIWVEQLFSLNSVEEVSVGCEVGVGIAVACGPAALLSLAVKTLKIVLSPGRDIWAVAPRGSILAGFVVECLQLALAELGKDGEISSEPPAKMPKLEPGPGQGSGPGSRAKEAGESWASAPSCSSADGVLSWVFAGLSSVCRDGEVKAATYFTASVLRRLAHHDHPAAQRLVQSLPLTLLNLVIRTDPKLISPQTVLALHNLSERKTRLRALQNLCLLRQLRAL